MAAGGPERVGTAFTQVRDEVGDAPQEPLRRAEHGPVEAAELGPARQRSRGGRPRAQVPVERGHLESEEEDPGVQRHVCALGELGRLCQNVTELAVDGASVRGLVGAVVPDLRGERGSQPNPACLGRVLQEEVEDVSADGEGTAALLRWVSRRLGGRGDAVQVPRGASQR
ncbi:hypothetical protein [Blastococcus saxobsidens]|uniref:hypothetical protein n=1 Tax=Blastococcus saxobsidens TaxID=138336 RepID=UPI00059F16A8|nr:hypothetical protein [Blastococcus saxobsidens]